MLTTPPGDDLQGFFNFRSMLPDFPFTMDGCLNLLGEEATRSIDLRFAVASHRLNRSRLTART
jgi:hypothetical protein